MLGAASFSVCSVQLHGKPTLSVLICSSCDAVLISSDSSLCPLQSCSTVGSSKPTPPTLHVQDQGRDLSLKSSNSALTEPGRRRPALSNCSPGPAPLRPLAHSIHARTNGRRRRRCQRPEPATATCAECGGGGRKRFAELKAEGDASPTPGCHEHPHRTPGPAAARDSEIPDRVQRWGARWRERAGTRRPSVVGVRTLTGRPSLSSSLPGICGTGRGDGVRPGRLRGGHSPPEWAP
jgi:hypothetical protein